jgi:hypothetical protein
VTSSGASGRAARSAPLRIRIVALAIAAACALALVAHSDILIVSWALRAARQGDPRMCAAAASKLERLGERGVEALLALAADGMPLGSSVHGAYARLVPPDAVCDVALDSLRRLRLGRPAYRTFEWDADSSPYATYEEALNAYRLEEFNASLDWWESHRTIVDSTP